MTTVQQGPRAVAARLAAEVSSKCGFFEVAPNGAVIEWTEIRWLRVAGNRTAEHWVNSDQLGILRQLGPGNEPE